MRMKIVRFSCAFMLTWMNGLYIVSHRQTRKSMRNACHSTCISHVTSHKASHDASCQSIPPHLSMVSRRTQEPVRMDRGVRADPYHMHCVGVTDLPEPAQAALLKTIAIKAPKALWRLAQTCRDAHARLLCAPESTVLWADAFRALLVDATSTVGGSDTNNGSLDPSSWLRSLATQFPLLAAIAVAAGPALSPHELSLALLIAIAAGRTGACRRLIEFGAKLQLSTASSHDPSATINQISLAAGIPLNRLPSFFPDPLHFAAETGLAAVVVMILDAGDIPGRVHLCIGTPLSMASAHGHSSVISVLLRLGAPKSSTPTLCDAASYGDLDLLNWLLSRGENPNMIDARSGHTPIVIASLAGHDQIIMRLVAAGATVGVPPGSSSKLSPMVAAITRGHVTTLRILLAIGKTYGDVYPIASVLFTEACRAGRSDMIDAIRASGTYCNVDMQSIMIRAMEYGHTDICKSIVDAVDLDHRDGVTGYTLLHRAASLRSVACCDVLVRAGSSIHARDKVYDTPLHVAAEQGALDVVKMLVHHGADVHARNRAGDTPLHVATARDHAAVCGWLVDAGADVHALNADGNTPLHVAVESNAIESATCLAGSCGASANAINHAGETSLHSAASRGNLRMCQALMQHGAQVNAITTTGLTALDLCVGKDVIGYIQGIGGLTSIALGQLVYRARLQRLLSAC